MRCIEQYELAKPKVDEIELKDFRGYQVGKLLYASLWGMYSLTSGQKLKRILALLACKTLWLSDCEDTVDGQNLALEVRFPGEKERKDNKAIFQNLYQYMKPAKHLLLEKHYQLHLLGTLKRLNRLLRYCIGVNGFSLLEKLYLAAQLVLVKELSELLEKKNVFQNIKYMLIFQEYDTISSTVIQYAHQHAVRVISPQHSMPMNRHENTDQLFFDGFLCDYKLVWNDFEKDQYLLAGVDPNRLFVVGNTKTLGEPQRAENSAAALTQEQWRSFGVLLDYPKSDGAIEASRQLLAVAKALAESEGMRCIVKLHPTDHAKRYADVLDTAWAQVLSPEVSMEEYQERVAFSLAHVTGAIFDLICNGYYVFQYIRGEKYPVDLDDIYRFTSLKELTQNVRQWRDDFEQYQKEYEKIIQKYRVTDARRKHDVFFQKLFAGELDSPK